MSDKSTKDDPAGRSLKKISRNKLIAVVIVLGTIVIAIGNFADAVKKIDEFFDRMSDAWPRSIAAHQSVVLETARQAKVLFDATTNGRRVPVAKSEFAQTEKLLGRLERLDPGNGHAIYYRASIMRWTGNRFGSHAILFNYIEGTRKPDAIQKDDNGLALYCFDYWRGFCKQRAAYANHLLALDLRDAAAAEKDPKLSQQWRKDAIARAQAAVDLYGGFSNPTQGTPTRLMLEELEKELASSAAGSIGVSTR